MKLAPLLVAPTSLLVLVAVGASAHAHPAPYAHKHVSAPHAEVVVIKKKKKKKKVVKKVIYRPAPPTTVVVHEPEPVVETVVVTPAPRPVVVAPKPTVVRRTRSQAVPRTFPRGSESISIGLRGSGAAMEGNKIGLSGDENMLLGGAGLSMRARFGKNFGAELTADIMGGGTEDVTQTSIPVMAALTYHFLPYSRFQPYLVAGAGVHFTQLDYLGGKYRHELIEPAAQLGAGAELFLTDDISIHADLRGTSVFKNIDSQTQIRQDCINQIGGMSGFCDGINGNDPTDKIDLGLTFHAGASIHF